MALRARTGGVCPGALRGATDVQKSSPSPLRPVSNGRRFSTSQPGTGVYCAWSPLSLSSLAHSFSDVVIRLPASCHACRGNSGGHDQSGFGEHAARKRGHVRVVRWQRRDPVSVMAGNNRSWLSQPGSLFSGINERQHRLGECDGVADQWVNHLCPAFLEPQW